MQRAWVQAAFNPRGAAVVGSCGDPSKLAWGTLQALQRGFQRPIVAVDRHINDHRQNASSRSTTTTFVVDPRDVPVNVAERIDLAVLVTSRDRCIGRMGECIDAFPNLKAVNVVSGGFREAQHENLEEQIVNAARDAGIRLIGPNSVGIIDTYNNFQSMFLRTFPKRGGISLISQSGGVCGSVVELLSNPCRGMGMNKVISLGNAADVGFAETLEAIGEDERTRIVLLYLEGLRDADEGEEFIRCARRLSLDKPIVALKAGSSEDAARAVSSHTGALAGNRMVYEAALRRAGIIQATSLREMLDMAQALTCHPRVALPAASSSRDTPESSFDQRYRVAVVTNAGGPAALAVDALTQSGAASVPSLPPPLQEEISSRPGVHALSSTSNPVDLLGGATPCSYRSAVEACMSDGSVDAVLALHVPTALSCPRELATELAVSKRDCSASPQKPLLGLCISDDREYISPALFVLSSASIPTSCHSEGIAAAFDAWKQREERNRFLQSGRKDDDNCLKLSESQIQQCREYFSRLGSGWVLEHNARTLLNILGIEQAKAELVPIGSCSKDVLDAAEKLGYPVVLKRVDRVHKSTAGGVTVNLQNSEQVLQALHHMFPGEYSSLSAPILVCEYISVTSSGLNSIREFLVGAIRDDIFGPVICFGTGGAMAEVIKDVAFALSPETRLESLELLNRSVLMHSKPRLDWLVMAATVEKISALVQLFPAIVELDVNPVIVGLSNQGETRAIAVDVKFRLEQ